MARIGLSLLLLGTALLQHTYADPRPELGSAGTVQYSAAIKAAALDVLPEFALIDDRNGYTLKTDYAVLHQVQPIVERICTQITSLGSDLMNAIVASIPKNNGDITAAFAPIGTALTSIKSYLDTTLPGIRDQLSTMLDSTDITRLFNDTFGALRTEIGRLETSLNTLKAALKATAPKNGKTSIPFGTVTAVQTSLLALKPKVQTVGAFLKDMIDNLKETDSFLNDMELLSITLASNLNSYFTDFGHTLGGLETLMGSMSTTVDTRWDTIENGIPAATSSMSALAQFTDMQTALNTFKNNAHDTTNLLPGTYTVYFNDYLNQTNTYLVQYTNILVPRNFESVSYLIAMRLGLSTFSWYCFIKYYPELVYNYALLTLDVDLCYNRETYRLDYLVSLIEGILQLAAIDVEDLLDNLTYCNTQATPATCIGTIGPYYKSLSEKTYAKVQKINTIGLAETEASVKRLGSCIYYHKMKNVQLITEVMPLIQDCTVNGV